jgi:hypothetical protein
MLSQLWSDPFITAVVALIVVLVLGVIAACVEIYRDGRASGVTTAAELRKDAQTAERQKSLRKMQGRAAARCACSRRQDLREVRSGKGSQR